MTYRDRKKTRTEEMKQDMGGAGKHVLCAGAYEGSLRLFELAGIFSSLDGPIQPIVNGQPLGEPVPAASLISMDGNKLNPEFVLQLLVSGERCDIIITAALEEKAAVNTVLSLLASARSKMILGYCIGTCSIPRMPI